MIVCAGNNELFDFAVPVGVGLIDSSINLTSILKKMDKKPDFLIFVGTAGLYKDGEILGIYESFCSSNIEISSILELSYSPIKNQISSFNCDDKFLSSFGEFLNLKKSNLIVSRETIRVNSSNYITTSKDIAYKFSNLGYFLENMEFYSILKVANYFDIPSFGIFCATNFCDKNAHKDFIKNHKDAKNKLEKYVKERLK